MRQALNSMCAQAPNDATDASELGPLSGEGQTLYVTKLAIIFLTSTTLQTVTVLSPHLSYNSVPRVNISLDPEQLEDVREQCGVCSGRNGMAVRR